MATEYCHFNALYYFATSICCRWSDCIESNSELFGGSVDSILTLISTLKTCQHNMQHYQVDRLEKVMATIPLDCKTLAEWL